MPIQDQTYLVRSPLSALPASALMLRVVLEDSALFSTIWLGHLVLI